MQKRERKRECRFEREREKKEIVCVCERETEKEKKIDSMYERENKKDTERNIERIQADFEI